MPQAPPNALLSPDGTQWWDGETWHPVGASSAPANAPVSPDGTQWWDGETWHPIGARSAPRGSAKSLDLSKLPVWLGGAVLIGAGVLMFIALLLPWLSVTNGFASIDRNALQLGPYLSLDSNGISLLIVSGVWVIGGLMNTGLINTGLINTITPRSKQWIWSLVATIAMAVSLIATYSALSSFSPSNSVVSSVGVGYYIAWVAVLILGVAPSLNSR